MQTPSWMRVTPYSLNRMTHKCKNITLPQTPFVDGKKKGRGYINKRKGEIKMREIHESLRKKMLEKKNISRE